jgi:hypothetical protein
MVAGCGYEEPLVLHELPKLKSGTGSHVAGGQKSEAELNPTDRMLVGVAIENGVAWFFKTSGSLKELDPQVESIKSFLKSVTFDENGNADWQVPDDWTEEPGKREMRVATFKLPDKKTEFVVSQLSVTTGQQEYLKINIDRWRGQMGLGEVGLDQVDGMLPKVEGAKTNMRLLDISGQFGGGMRMK